MNEFPFNKEQLNALQHKIHRILLDHPIGISEYQLLQCVAEHPLLQTISGQGNVQLFQRHFLLRHCLYCLQRDLAEANGDSIEITPLMITLFPAHAAQQQIQSAANNLALRQFYLDENNIHTSTEEIENLLTGFWQHYVKYINQDEAWEVLGLQSGSSLQEVTDRYRTLAARNHPDKGGDEEAFIKIRSAYESLRSLLK